MALVRLGLAETRAEIEVQSGLGRAAVADRLTTLVGLGLVEERDLAISTRGRAPRRVRFNAGAGHVLVGSLGTTTLGVGLADLSGRLLVEHHEATDATYAPEQSVSRIDELFDWILSEHPAAQRLWGIALAVPGPVELEAGRLSSPPVLPPTSGLEDHPIREHLVERLGTPVWIDNDAHLMALGELRLGRGVGRDDLLFIKIGTGISAGLCANGQIHRGAHGYAGDIGHVAVGDDETVICRCGNRGCLDALAGGEAIARAARSAALDGRSPVLADLASRGRAITAADVGIASQRGDPFSVDLLSRSGRMVGEVLAPIVSAINPSQVVVGGGVAQAGEVMLGSIREALYRRSRSLAVRDLRVVRSELGKSGALIGAALAAGDELFARDSVRTWIHQGSPVRPQTPPAARPRQVADTPHRMAVPEARETAKLAALIPPARSDAG